jgi:uncharacterized membrane protein
MEKIKFFNFRSKIKEIIKDFIEYFDYGKSERKAEQKLCYQFSEPFKASELVNIKEREVIHLHNSSKRNFSKFIFLILFLLYMFTIINYTPTYPTNMNLFIDLILSILLPLTILLFIYKFRICLIFL